MLKAVVASFEVVKLLYCVGVFCGTATCKGMSVRQMGIGEDS